MLSKIKGKPEFILEPSAGKGDLIEAMKNYRQSTERYYNRPYEHAKFAAIEINPDLQATLRGKCVKVIDNDFLAYSGQDKFDLIIANPPFDEGDRHLMKAIDIMYRGEIVFLLNAETIRNPHTKLRKTLLKKLNELGAKIDYIKNAFKDAERKTDVEVALVYIKIDRKIEDDLFAGCKDKATKTRAKIKEKNEVSTGKTVPELVAEYNDVIRLGTETIANFYRNYNKVGKYLSIFGVDEKNHSRRSDDDLTSMVQDDVNGLIITVRKDFWRSTLKLGAVSSRLTASKQKEFEHQLQHRCDMDFTEANIYQFIQNIIGGYEATLIAAVLEVFDKMTKHGYRDDTEYEENIHYFNGWKTNNSFKVGKKVVLPMYWGAFWDPSWNSWGLKYETAQILNDFDKICSYFDGNSKHGYLSIGQALEQTIGRQYGKTANPQTRGIESTYFTITVFKKNTIHLTFKDEDLLRRFNVVACRGKGWLPDDYGQKKYADMPPEEKTVADSFDGKKTYDANVNTPLFRIANTQLQIGC
jgi:hypothetical protein